MDLGMTGYQLISTGVSNTEAGVLVRNDVQVETAAANVLEFAVPVHCEVIAFGVNITEDFSAHAVDPVVSLKKALTVGGSETVLKALTLGSSNTTLTRGNGDRNVLIEYPKDNQVAIAADADLDNGDVVYANLDTLDTVEPVTSLHFWPGEVLIIEATTAAGEAGGAYAPWAIVKISGPDFTQDNTWRELRSGESVLD